MGDFAMSLVVKLRAEDEPDAAAIMNVVRAIEGLRVVRRLSQLTPSATTKGGWRLFGAAPAAHMEAAARASSLRCS